MPFLEQDKYWNAFLVNMTKLTSETRMAIATKMIMISMILKENILFNAIYIGVKLKIIAKNESISQSNNIWQLNGSVKIIWPKINIKMRKEN